MVNGSKETDGYGFVLAHQTKMVISVMVYRKVEKPKVERKDETCPYTTNKAMNKNVIGTLASVSK